MAASPTLSETIGSKFDALEASGGPAGGTSTPGSGEQTPGTAAPASNGQAAPGETPGAEGTTQAASTPGETTPTEKPKLSELGFEGLDEEEKTKPEGGTQTADGETPSGKLELKIAEDMIVGEMDGKPMTAAQLKNAVAAHADVTRTRQELSTYRKNAEPAVQFVAENLHIIEKLNQGGMLLEQGNQEAGQRMVIEALTEAAKDWGVDLTSAFGGSRERDPVTGRFVASASADPQADLEEIEKEYGKDSAAYRTAVQNIELQKQFGELKSKVDGITGGIEKAQQAQATRAEVDTWAQKWAEKGIEGVDVSAAYALVGKPISAAQALQLSNLAAFLRWRDKTGQTVGSARRPDEPGSSAVKPSFDWTGKSLSRGIEEKMERMGRQ